MPNHTTLLHLLVLCTVMLTVTSTTSYLYTPRHNVYDGVHLRDDRENLTEISPVRHVRPRPYRGYPYGEPDPWSAASFGAYAGEYRPGRGFDIENAPPPSDLRSNNRYRPHARFWVQMVDEDGIGDGDWEWRNWSTFNRHWSSSILSIVRIFIQRSTISSLVLSI